MSLMCLSRSCDLSAVFMLASRLSPVDDSARTTTDLSSTSSQMSYTYIILFLNTKSLHSEYFTFDIHVHVFSHSNCAYHIIYVGHHPTKLELMIPYVEHCPTK